MVQEVTAAPGVAHPGSLLIGAVESVPWLQGILWVDYTWVLITFIYSFKEFMPCVSTLAGA